MEKLPLHILITGGTGEVGSYASLFLARMGVADKITLVSRHPGSLSTICHNAQTNATMRGFGTIVKPVRLDLSEPGQSAQVLSEIKPDVIINCAAGMSLFSYFPSMRKRQKRMGMIPGFAHTLPKDLVVLYPLMKAIRQAVPNAVVVNLSAPDLAGPILHDMGLAPQIGAGTLDSTSQGVAAGVAEHLGVRPDQITVRMVAHHALRRFPANEVPFFIRLYADGKEITGRFTKEELCGFVNYATDITGVETMNGPVTNNASITGASAVETACAIARDEGIVRHCSGWGGLPGSAPVALYRDRTEISLPEGVTFEKAKEINTVGMVKDGCAGVKPGGTAVFTESEQYWIKESLGLDWTECPLEGAAEMCEELRAAYNRMDAQEKATA